LTPETRDPKPETRNPELEIRNPRLEPRNLPGLGPGLAFRVLGFGFWEACCRLLMCGREYQDCGSRVSSFQFRVSHPVPRLPAAFSFFIAAAGGGSSAGGALGRAPARQAAGRGDEARPRVLGRGGALPTSLPPQNESRCRWPTPRSSPFSPYNISGGPAAERRGDN